jgi:8-oxo-dGTP pyrophosphatase MutT (NUDIX family)
MYKVFFNDSLINLASNIKKSSNDNIEFEAEIANYHSVDEIINDIESTKFTLEFYLLNPDIDLLWTHFKNRFYEIPAAGGLVQSQNGELLFIKRLGVWDLPKGKIENGETSELAAIREVEEECGVNGLSIKKSLGSTFHIYRSPHLKQGHNLVLKETHWFLMNCDDNQNLVPQTEEQIEEVRWFKPEEINEVMENTYRSIAEFLAQIIPII